MVLLTRAPLLLEFALAAGLVVDKRFWRPLLLASLLFHLGIALFMAIISFSLAMFAALILYLLPAEQPFRLHLALPMGGRKDRKVVTPDVAATTLRPD